MSVAIFGKFSEFGAGKYSERSKGGGGGIVDTHLPYGGMYLAGANARPTSLTINVPVKIEAGDELAPLSPPLYGGYTDADALSQWLFVSGDTGGGRLQYNGSEALVHTVTMSCSGYMPSGAGAQLFLGIVKNGDDILDVRSTQPVYWPLLGTDNTPANFSIDYQGLFLPGDYIECWVLNSSNSFSPLVTYLRCYVQAIAPAPALVTGYWLDQDGNNVADNNNNPILISTPLIPAAKTKSRMSSLVNKQIYQFPPKNAPALTDLCPFSDEENSHETVQTTWQNIFNLFAASLPAGTFTPIFSNLLGISGDIALVSASYFCSNPRPGGIIISSAQFVLTSDSSGDLMSLDMTDAVPTNFTDQFNAQLIGFSIVKTADIGNVGTIGSGWENLLVAKNGGGTTLTLEGATVDTEYLVNVTWFSNIQPEPRSDNNEK